MLIDEEADEDIPDDYNLICPYEWEVNKVKEYCSCTDEERDSCSDNI